MYARFYELSGLIAFIVSWCGMLLTVYVQGKDKTKSISLHAAASRSTFLLLAVLSPISMSLYMIFATKWIAPMYNMSSFFVVVNAIANSGYILAAWVPATSGIRGKLHDIFSYGASIVLIPIVLIMATTPAIGNLPRLINIVLLINMAVIFGILILHKPAKANYLYYQIAYFLSFNIALLSTGYMR